ncbi:MAG: hypothetical protein KJ697_01265 [Nanoarchaeota archaeon]|nr:hypothetical protein [Nanoarchaeota archaeon]
MTMILDNSENTAKCVGLWLAEGDSKTKYEITFTNNCWDTIELFHETMKNIFKEICPRIYVYFPSKENITDYNYENIRFRYYIDERANKPYYIYRIGNVNFTKNWHNIINDTKTKKELYKYILQGFFAGEGNIKTGSHSNRTVRISQGTRNMYVENILNYFNIKYNYSNTERSYVITGRKNWEILNSLDLSILNKEKNIKFNDTFLSYKQWHYPKNHIKNEIIKILDTPKTSKELAHLFKRGQPRIQTILTKLKRNKLIINFRIGSNNYWIKTDKNIILISKRKLQILELLEIPHKISDISKQLSICWKATSRRLNELKRLGLVENKGYLWYKLQTKKEVMTL